MCSSSGTNGLVQWWASPKGQSLTASDNTLVQTCSLKAKVLKLLMGKVVCCWICQCMQWQWHQWAGVIIELLCKDNPSQQVVTLWYRLIATQGQSAEATAWESSLLLNRPMHAVAVAPMGLCNGWASLEGQSLTASDNTLVQTYSLTRPKCWSYCWGK